MVRRNFSVRSTREQRTQGQTQQSPCRRWHFGRGFGTLRSSDFGLLTAAPTLLLHCWQLYYHRSWLPAHVYMVVFLHLGIYFVVSFFVSSPLRKSKTPTLLSPPLRCQCCSGCEYEHTRTSARSASQGHWHTGTLVTPRSSCPVSSCCCFVSCSVVFAVRSFPFSVTARNQDLVGFDQTNLFFDSLVPSFLRFSVFFSFFKLVFRFCTCREVSHCKK